MRYWALFLILTVTNIQADRLPDDFDAMPADLQTTLLDFLAPEQSEIWGNKAVVSGTHTLVRYLDDYHTQVQVNFSAGWLRVETRGGNEPLQQLRQAIVSTLLTPADPRVIDLYTAADFGLTGKPFLVGQVTDHEGKNIETQWRAQRFAEHLLKNNLIRTSLGYRVNIPMVQQHQQVAAKGFKSAVSRASQKYGIAPALIYAVIDVESSFNPLAVSPSKAYGLMQVMPQTAGRDVMLNVYGKNKAPSRNYLLNPENNIDMGTAYLSLISNNYLRNITNAQTREYCTIASYNGGTGNLLKAFHSDRTKAIQRINRMSSKEVYNHLLRKHPRQETRNYLKKVTAKQAHYG